jgi:hypothetical protein
MQRMDEYATRKAASKAMNSNVFEQKNLTWNDINLEDFDYYSETIDVVNVITKYNSIPDSNNIASNFENFVGTSLVQRNAVSQVVPSHVIIDFSNMDIMKEKRFYSKVINMLKDNFITIRAINFSGLSLKALFIVTLY